MAIVKSMFNNIGLIYVSGEVNALKVNKNCIILICNKF